MSRILRNLPDIFSKKKDSNLKALTGSMDNVLETVSKDLDLLELQYNMQTATGVWLDMWGDWFGILRDKNETDDVYRNRIMTTTLRPKCTIPALIGAIRNYLEDDEAPIHIHEPYLDLFRHNQSIWGDKNYYTDSVYYSRGVIDIHSEVTLDEPLRDLIEQIKSAGIKVTYTEMLFLSSLPMEMYSDISPQLFTEKTSEMFIHWMTAAEFTLSHRGLYSGDRVLWGVFTESVIEFYTSRLVDIENNHPIEESTEDLGYYSMSSRGTYSNDRGSRSGYRLTQYDLENPLPYEDTLLRFKGKYIPLKEKREAYTNVSRSMAISNFEDANKSGVVKYSHKGPASGYKILWTEKHSSSTMFSILSNKLNAGSSIILEDIWGESLRDVNLLEDNSQLPIESISEAV